MQMQSFGRTYDASTRVRRRKNVHTPPDELPGHFFLIEYDRETECFTLIVDDMIDASGASSYNLGSDMPELMLYFRLIGLEEIGNRTIDIAKEFGAAQAILRDGRVVPLIEGAETNVDVFKESDNARIPAYI